MCSTPNGSGCELKQEKFPDADAPPSIPPTPPAPDAGMKSLDHCTPIFSYMRCNLLMPACVAVALNTMLTLEHADKRRLPSWRYNLRQKLLPLIRWETPYLAWMQDKMRSPALDSYFAITANLGTHTFFMTALPILFWCGHTSLGRGMVHILAS